MTPITPMLTLFDKPKEPTIPQASLGENVNAMPGVAGYWAYSLVRAPHKDKSAGKILEFLRVEISARYAKIGGTTYCNVFAHDYCHLRGVYLPRVWWGVDVLARVKMGKLPAPTDALYGKTVFELNANSLCTWLANYGRFFGWEYLGAEEQDQAQAAVNAGAVGVICAQRKELSKPGHISCIVPEVMLPEQRAYRKEGKVIAPLQAQAGAVNFTYGHNLNGGIPWQHASVFRSWGIWINKGKP